VKTPLSPPGAATPPGAVAVVDDEEAVRRALARLLAVAGYEVWSFPSGEAFLASLADRKPGCVVLDLHMPRLDGLSVLRTLRSGPAPLPVIVITGHDSPEWRSRCLAAGVVAYLGKPFDDTQLLDAVDQALNGPR
jgi:FixJ family two-component response regulator